MTPPDDVSEAVEIGYKLCPRCPDQHITLITQATENIWSEDCPYCGFNFGVGPEGAMRQQAEIWEPPVDMEYPND